MSAKSTKSTMPKKAPDKNNTPTNSVQKPSESKTNTPHMERKNGILPPRMCTTCATETENDDDIFKCDGCFATYHILCDGVRKGDVTARMSSVNLRLFCSTCSRKNLDILNCQKLSVIYDYVVKIDCHTQKQVEKQADTVDKLTTVVSETKILNEKIGDFKSTNNDIKKPSFSSVLKQNKKPVVIIRPKNDKQLCNKTVEELKKKINHREINACGIRNVRNGGVAVNCDSSQSTVKL